MDGHRRDIGVSFANDTFTTDHGWNAASVFWTGILGTGSHTAWLQSPTANAWGCDQHFGDLDVLLLPALKGMAAYQTPDTHATAARLEQRHTRG